jgi:hypothetical protein
MNTYKRAGERIVIELRDGLSIALTRPSGSFTIAAVNDKQYSQTVYGYALREKGLSCTVNQGDKIVFDGEINGPTQFSADRDSAEPVVISFKIRENEVLFTKCYIVIGKSL